MMLTITVKNVGHGDSIILEWLNETGVREIGIIDCHQEEKYVNPIIDHLTKSAYKKIRFMILTHPHTDHFSGFLKLLEFCSENKIKIERFWHTAAYNKYVFEKLVKREVSLHDFSDSFVGRKQDKQRLRKLIQLIHNLHIDSNRIVENVGFPNDTSMLWLHKKKMWLEYISPSYDEFKEYIIQNFYFDSNGELKINQIRQNNPSGNIISSVIKISTDKWHVLFTSDVTSFTFKRIMKKYLDEILDNKLILSQVPHHGSKNNHCAFFWSEIPGKEHIPVFLSVGSKFELPDIEVIQFFDKNYKEILSTNFVGGYKEYYSNKKYNYNQKLDEINMFLDYFGMGVRELDVNPHCCGEKKIQINNKGFIEVETTKSLIENPFN